MQEIEVIILFIGSIYGTFTLLLAHFKVINERRDELVDPKSGKDLAARINSFRSDWIPLQIGMVSAMLFMTVFIVIIFFSVMQNGLLSKPAIILLFIMSFLIHFGAFLGHLWGGVQDYIFIKKRLEPRRHRRMVNDYTELERNRITPISE